MADIANDVDLYLSRLEALTRPWSGIRDDGVLGLDQIVDVAVVQAVDAIRSLDHPAVVLERIFEVLARAEAAERFEKLLAELESGALGSERSEPGPERTSGQRRAPDAGIPARRQATVPGLPCIAGANAASRVNALSRATKSSRRSIGVSSTIGGKGAVSPLVRLPAVRRRA